MLLISSPRFEEHVTPPGHPERLERAHVFNSVAVPGDDYDFNKWYGAVQALQSDTNWRTAYATTFGKPATQFADVYYDATNLLLTRLTEVSKTVNGKLVIDRAELAEAVRNTTNFPGVTCSISLDTGGYRINDISACAP